MGLGFTVSAGINQPVPDAVNIVLGAQLGSPALSSLLPRTTIIFNTEQVDEASPWMAGELPRLIARFPAWDYSPRNIGNWKRLVPDARLSRLQVGYVPALTRIPQAEVEDIDVLFYGSVNDRRRAALRQIEALGLRLHVAFDCYGAERDALISRAKLVLNLHAFDAQIFEVVRVSYLLANRKAVVAEIDDATEVDPAMREAVAGAPCDRLADTCAALLADDEQRHLLSQRGYDIMRGIDACECLREPVAAALAQLKAS